MGGCPLRKLNARLGIDVGGTNTDAVVLDPGDQLVAKAKVPTTGDVSHGIAAAVEAVLGSGAATRGLRGRGRPASPGTRHSAAW